DGATSISAGGGDSIGGGSALGTPVPPLAIPAPKGVPQGLTDGARLGVDIAPYPFAPALQQGAAGLTVQGYGSATAAADEAVIEMWFYRDAYSFYEEQPFPTMLPDGSISYGPDGDIDFSPQTPTPVEPITEAELAPVIAALESFGASVEFVDENYGYRDPYYSNATLRATMTNLGSVDDAVAAAITAADGIADINNSGSNTYFSLSDCSALERAAMVAAVEDAEERADALADVLGVGRGAVIGASSYSYSPYGDSSCSSSYGYAKDGSTLGATDVQVFANVGVTYAIQ
ncbi:MAG: SIMPL domain-containing protein, partial [Chloroflexi bacterium]|nr:SIMPL domain-containing protein [Chloroflexota bacterium]